MIIWEKNSSPEYSASRWKHNQGVLCDMPDYRRYLRLFWVTLFRISIDERNEKHKYDY